MVASTLESSLEIGAKREVVEKQYPRSYSKHRHRDKPDTVANRDLQSHQKPSSSTHPLGEACSVKPGCLLAGMSRRLTTRSTIVNPAQVVHLNPT